jgi:hypothetical protein
MTWSGRRRSRGTPERGLQLGEVEEGVLARDETVGRHLDDVEAMNTPTIFAGPLESQRPVQNPMAATEGLTLGRLAEALRTSKSGIQTLFGTKQELQLSIVAAASQVFERDVLLAAEQQPAGLPRLRALMSLWIDYLETFEGGCLFVAAASELDGRSGPV